MVVGASANRRLECAHFVCFLLGTGLHDLLLPGLDGKWLRRLGASPVGSPDARPLGAIRITLGPTPRALTGDCITPVLGQLRKRG